MIPSRISKRTVGAAVSAAATGLTAAATIVALAPAPVSAGTGSDSAAGTGTDSASGIVTSGLGIPPLSTVTSLGAPQDSSLVSVPANPALTASVLHVLANAAEGTARASAADLNIAGGKLIASLVTASCAPGGGTATLLDAVLAGQRIPVSPAPNTTIALPPGAGQIAAITLNKQVKNDRGGLTVTAIELRLGTGDAQKTIDVSTANCVAPAAHTTPGVPAAPAPTPQRRSLPVTG
jgi:hypothetical protein